MMTFTVLDRHNSARVFVRFIEKNNVHVRDWLTLDSNEAIAHAIVLASRDIGAAITDCAVELVVPGKNNARSLNSRLKVIRGLLPVQPYRISFEVVS